MRLSLTPQLLQRGDRLLVAVSGGVDSLALLHALAGERDAAGWELFAAHVHHGMRGEAADADVGFLAARCAEWQVPLRVERVDVPAFAEQRRISVEEAGRDARYAALDRLSRELGCRKVVTAHHADDQAETVLLHLFRGAGLDGLAAMPERRPLTSAPGAPELVRPLLRMRRADLEAYCRAHGLEPRLDITNLDLHYRRNRIRYELLPTLSGYDPAIVDHLLRLSQQARDEQELFAVEVERLLQSAIHGVTPLDFGIPLPAPPPSLVLKLEPLRAVSPALLRRMLRRVLRQTAGYDVEVSADLIERLLLLVGADAGAVDLPGCAYRAAVAAGCLHLEACLSEVPPPSPVAVVLPGYTTAPGFGLTLEAVEGPVPSNLRTPPFQALLHPDSVGSPLLLSAPVVGDRFRPLNAPGSRLVSDLFRDRKVPAYLRHRWPILRDRDGILWVLGLAVAHRVRIRPSSERVLRLTVKGAPGKSPL